MCRGACAPASWAKWLCTVSSQLPACKNKLVPFPAPLPSTVEGDRPSTTARACPARSPPAQPSFFAGRLAPHAQVGSPLAAQWGVATPAPYPHLLPPSPQPVHPLPAQQEGTGAPATFASFCVLLPASLRAPPYQCAVLLHSGMPW